MNISIELQKITVLNIYFLEKKKNIIMDGNFTKLIYSNEWFTMNGLYILFPLEIIGIEKNLNKNILKINPYQSTNVFIIQEISKLEQRIIEYYKTLTQSKCKNSNLLSRQLNSGSIKLYKDFNSLETKNTGSQYVIKISGVWENYEEVGITYKLIEVSEYSL
jgi:hypothetical protein